MEVLARIAIVMCMLPASLAAESISDATESGKLPRREHGNAISHKDRTFWSFQPLTRVRVPGNQYGKFDGNSIDSFVLHRLIKNGLSPAPCVDRRTLIRRATYDLIGLPPRPSEIEAFLKDDRPGAFERVVERLLASPHYGERWGRHWLDLVRYADTAGDAADFPVPEAFRYRNYVIKAFNEDKPYDDFIREQIAGDVLPFENDEDRWEKTIATGYVAISRRIGVSPHNLRHITIEDTLDNLGKTFLGLTLGCARCHDHKFDPIPTEDYYALYGIFDSSVYPHAGAEHQPYREDFVYRIGKEKSDEILAPYRTALALWNRKERAQLAVYRSFQSRKVADLSLTRENTWEELLRVREQLRKVAETFPNLEIAYAIKEGEPHDVAVQKAGNPSRKARGAVVRRGFLRILGGTKLSDEAMGSGRRELADWISNSANPLTARVMVNRLWHHHFGKGIVTTVSDFGVRGTRPTHPALLDFLAAYFIDQGWSIKQMHRLIMLSRTYQLASLDNLVSSEKDPENRLLWRANRRRLDAEQIRDSILMFSGQLNLTPGQRHSFPHHLTYFYRQHEPFVGDFETQRRSVYMMQQRIQKNPYLDLFDGPDGNLHFGERKATATTLQALFSMNSEFVHEQSGAIAERLLEKGMKLRDCAHWAYRSIFGRPASDGELVRASDFFESALSKLSEAGIGKRAARQKALAGYIRSMLGSNEFMYVD